MKEEQLIQELTKRALGYSVTESSEEYAMVDGELKLVKQKLTNRHIPPDISAFRLLLEIGRTEGIDDLSDEQLSAELNNLLATLGFVVKGKKSEKNIAKHKEKNEKK